MPAPLTTVDWPSMVSEYMSGKSVAQIHREHKFNEITIRKYLRRHGVQIRSFRSQVSISCARKINHHAFADAEHNEDAAYWVGMLATDGCLFENSKRNNIKSIHLALSGEDATHVDKLKEFLKSGHKITEYKPRIQNITSSYGKTYASPIKARRLFHASSQRIFDSLLRFGLTPRKTKTIKIEKLDFDRDFWRGAIDGDGTVGIYKFQGRLTPILMFCTGSHKFAEQFANFARCICVTETATRKAGSVWTFKLMGHYAAQVIHELYHNCKTALPRKLAVANRIIDQWPIPINEHFGNRYDIRDRMKECRLLKPTIF